MKNAPSIPVRPAYGHNQPSASHVQRAAFAAMIAASNNRGLGRSPIDVCRVLFPDDHVSPLLLERAAVTGASTTGWASELADQAVSAFLQSLAPQSAASKLIALGQSVPLIGNEDITIPVRPGGPVTLPWVGEGAPIALRAESLSTVILGPSRKLGVLVVFSRELAKRSAAQSVFETTLREDAARSLDAAYFSDTAGSASAHAGLLNGVTGETASPATSQREAMAEDLSNLAAAVSENGSGQVVFIAAPGRAVKIPILAPDLQIAVLSSPAVPANRVIAVDPLSIIHGFGSDVEIKASIEGTLHMDTAPAQISTAGSPNTVAAPVQSMFQTAQTALRLLADVAFEARRADAVAFVDVTGW